MSTVRVSKQSNGGAAVQDAERGGRAGDVGAADNTLQSPESVPRVRPNHVHMVYVWEFNVRSTFACKHGVYIMCRVLFWF